MWPDGELHLCAFGASSLRRKLNWLDIKGWLSVLWLVQGFFVFFIRGHQKPTDLLYTETSLETKKNHLRLLCLGMSVAFCTFSHTSLLNRLTSNGILSWVQSNLCGQTQFIYLRPFRHQSSLYTRPSSILFIKDLLSVDNVIHNDNTKVHCCMDGIQLYTLYIKAWFILSSPLWTQPTSPPAGTSSFNRSASRTATSLPSPV